MEVQAVILLLKHIPNFKVSIY